MKRVFLINTTRKPFDGMRVVIFATLFIVILSGCNKEDVNWAINNADNTVTKNNSTSDTDIDCCNVSGQTVCFIALIDSGIALNNYIENSFDVLSEKTICINDIKSEHATEIASIIDGHYFKNGFTNNVQIINIRMDEDNLAPETLIKAIHYAEQKGAKVVNCSFSLSEKNDELNECIAHSQMLFICAAGNKHEENNEYPASLAETLDNVISVAGIGRLGLIASSSNFGDCVTIAAPGENVRVNNRFGSFYEVSGTSYATAFVSGVIGEVWAAFPDITAVDMKKAVVESAKQFFTLRGRVESGGMISMEKLYNYLVNKYQPASQLMK